MPSAASTFATQNASRYLQQLCKHFSHKVKVEYSRQSGSAELPGGKLKLEATSAALLVRLESEAPRDLVKARYILEDHLVRFAFKEKLLGLNWTYEAD